jgi:2-(1,2-epoxy-1,2-dihydrophenyl)acetyl-CoA isomerase
MKTMSPLLCATDNGVAVVRLNRPAQLNALNESLLVGLRDLLRELRRDCAIRAVLLTGNGRGFCSGAELRQEEIRDPGELLRVFYHPVIREMRALPKPIVVAVNGVAAGAGMSIALAGDIILGSDAASFCAAFSKIGLIPDAGSTFFLPRIAGDHRARAIAMLADRIDAQEAFRLGLLHKVLPPEGLMPEAQAVAQHLARMPTTAFALIKKALEASSSGSLDDQLELEAKLQSIASKTNDFREGVAAFLDKRAPVFTGS